MEILLNAEKVGQIGNFPVTNTLVASTVVVLFFIGVSFVIRGTKYNLKSRFYNFVEMLIEGFMGIVEGVVGRGMVARQIFGVILTFFLFIMFNNWFGIMPGMGSIGFWESKHQTEIAVEKNETTPVVTLPVVNDTKEGVASESVVSPEISKGEDGVKKTESKEEQVWVPLLRSTNSDLNMTLAIAIISVLFIQFVAITNIGLKHYLSKFFNFSSPILFFVGLLEIISEIVKIFSFSFRLFGNIFAGDVLLIVMFGLVPYVAPIPFMGIEMFAGFIQALIFSMLTLVFVNTSVSHGAH